MANEANKPNEPMEVLLDELEAMPSLLERRAAECPPEALRRKPAEGEFSFLENVWHLADLEREGFGTRIRRLRSEEGPRLPDFDGAGTARARDYNRLDLARGLAAFAESRRENLAALRSLGPADWDRAGSQEGVGPIRLRDVPRMMRDHDASHRREIEELFSKIR